MRTLVLLRHAKSSWDQSGLDDFSRPLAERGLKAAPVMGAHLSSIGAAPELILCSTAVRTRATLDLVLPACTTPPGRILFEDALYLASASDLLARLRTVPSNIKRVMLVGHNPGIHDLARGLAGQGARANLEALRLKFPTAGLAILTFDARSWSDVGLRTGTLTHFATPARLATVR
jgi:phosphohistidine phosphatase